MRDLGRSFWRLGYLDVEERRRRVARHGWALDNKHRPPVARRTCPLTRTASLSVQKALAAADRGYVLETGEIVLSDRAEKLALNPRVKKAYLGGA